MWMYFGRYHRSFAAITAASPLSPQLDRYHRSLTATAAA
jgi:hypothetical protein